MFEQSTVFHKAAIQYVYNVYYLETSSMCIFNPVEKQSGIGFIVDALFGNFVYLHGTAYKLCIDTFWKSAILNIATE